jgi:hypothetical protein
VAEKVRPCTTPLLLSFYWCHLLPSPQVATPPTNHTSLTPFQTLLSSQQQERKQTKKEKKNKAKNVEEQEEDIETILANFKKEVK